MNKTVSNPAATRELVLYAENTRSVYDATLPIIHNLQKKYNKGIFDNEKAVKAFENIAEYAAKLYCKEFAEPSQWFTVFNAATRRETARELLDGYMENIVNNDV